MQEKLTFCECTLLIMYKIKKKHHTSFITIIIYFFLLNKHLI